MSENSKIEWCDHTYNPWIGCTKVSPGCANCYAEKSTRARVLRAGGQETWGKGATRSRTKTQDDPRKWNRESERRRVSALHSWPAGKPMPWTRPRVFCASLADWLDDEVPVEWLADLLQLIHETPHLDWLLLTKRPQNWQGRLIRAHEFATPATAKWIASWVWGAGQFPANVWVGTTCEDQTRADQRIPELLAIPAAVRFLSCEPLLGPLDLREWMEWRDTVAGSSAITNHRSISWVIAGGESGPGARPMHPAWARDLRDQCQAAGVAFHFKQWGEWLPDLPLGDGSPDLLRSDGSWEQYSGCFHLKHQVEGLVSRGTYPMSKIGKKRAGRDLDGRTWDEFPDVATRATAGGQDNPTPATSPA